MPLPMNHFEFSQSPVTRRNLLQALAASAVAASAPILAQSPAPPDLSEIIRRNTLARGGAEVLDRVHSIAVEVEIVEGGQTLNGRYAANDQGLVRIDVYAAGELVASEGIDTHGVWILGEEGPELSVATGAANALLHGAENHLFGWHRFGDRSHRLALLPPANMEGTTYLVVEVHYSTGHVSYFYVDPVSWQAVRRRDERAYHPDVDQTKKRVETQLLDFRPVEGVVAAHRNEDYDLDSGKLLSVNRVISRRINPDLPADHFDRHRRAPATW